MASPVISFHRRCAPAVRLIELRLRRRDNFVVDFRGVRSLTNTRFAHYVVKKPFMMIGHSGLR